MSDIDWKVIQAFLHKIFDVYLSFVLVNTMEHASGNPVYGYKEIRFFAVEFRKISHINVKLSWTIGFELF
jgi:hypothetical protein